MTVGLDLGWKKARYCTDLFRLVAPLCLVFQGDKIPEHPFLNLQVEYKPKRFTDVDFA